MTYKNRKKLTNDEAYEVFGHAGMNDVRSLDDLHRHNGLSLKIIDNRRNTLLHIACQNGATEAVAWLIEQGVNVNAKNMSGHTPMHVTAMQCRESEFSRIVRYLYGKSPGLVNKIDFCGMTPIFHTILRHKDNSHRLSVLVNHGASLTVKNESGNTPVEYAVNCDSTMAVDYLHRQTIKRQNDLFTCRKEKLETINSHLDKILKILKGDKDVE